MKKTTLKLMWSNILTLFCIVLSAAAYAQVQSQTLTEECVSPIKISALTNSNAEIPEPYIASPGSKAVILWDNGTFVNRPGLTDTSVVQNLSLGLTTLGFNISVSSTNRVSDDFTIPPGVYWVIDSVIFSGFQTGSSTTSTFTSVNLRVWDGIPDSTGSIVWGDVITNRLVGSVWSNCYRVTEDNLSLTNRPIMHSTAATPGLVLYPGSYYLDCQSAGSLSSGPWAVPITVTGSATTGDARQYAGGVWTKLRDASLQTWQGLPFIVYGTSFLYTGVNTDDYSNYTVVFPNPASEYLFWTTNFQPSQIIVYDLTGRIMIKNVNPDKTGKIDLNGFQSGTYIIQFTDTESTVQKRFIVQ